MTYKNATTTIIFTILATSLMVFVSSEVYAEESKYKIADDVSATLTFHFKDGVEVIDFQVFTKCIQTMLKIFVLNLV